MIISLVGNCPGVGKDTSADLLVANSGFRKHSFARLLYEEVSRDFGVSIEFLQNRLTKESELPELRIENCSNPEFADLLRSMGVKEGQNLSPRFVLRRYGTEYRRNHYGEDYFLRPVAEEIESHPEEDWCIVDARLGNELLWSVRKGLVVRVRNPLVEAQAEKSNHASEILARVWPEDHEIQNAGSIEELAAQWEVLLRVIRNQ